MPNFSSLAGLEVAEKFLWGVGGVGWGGVVCTVIFVSNQPVVLGCVGVGVLTKKDLELLVSLHQCKECLTAKVFIKRCPSRQT